MLLCSKTYLIEKSLEAKAETSARAETTATGMVRYAARRALTTNSAAPRRWPTTEPAAE